MPLRAKPGTKQRGNATNTTTMGNTDTVSPVTTTAIATKLPKQVWIGNDAKIRSKLARAKYRGPSRRLVGSSC